MSWMITHILRDITNVIIHQCHISRRVPGYFCRYQSFSQSVMAPHHQFISCEVSFKSYRGYKRRLSFKIFQFSYVWNLWNKHILCRLECWKWKIYQNEEMKYLIFNCNEILEHTNIILEITHSMSIINTLRPRQNKRHFPDGILEWIFLNEKVWISIKFSLKFFP